MISKEDLKQANSIDKINRKLDEISVKLDRVKLDWLESKEDDQLSKLLSGRTQKLPVPLPEYDKPVFAIIKRHGSDEQQYAVLKAVDSENHVWVFNDDGFGLPYDYGVISWIYLPLLNSD